MCWHIHTQGLEVRQSLFNNFPSGLSAALRVGWNDRMAACHYCQLTPKLSSVWAIATAWLGGFFGRDLRSLPTFPISHFCTCRMAHTHMNANAAAAARTNAQPHCNHTRNPGRHPAGWRQWVKLIRRGMGALFEPNSKSTEIRMLSWFSLKFLKLSLQKFLLIYNQGNLYYTWSSSHWNFLCFIWRFLFPLTVRNSRQESLNSCK